jgi:uncharacterized repeat protein (TIGR01451 family)
VRSTHRGSRTRWLTLVSTVSLLLSSIYTAAAVSAAAPSVNTGSGIVVDGSFADWTDADFFADMHRAGQSDKQVESKLYLRYDCTAGILYVGVRPVTGVTVLESDDDNFVKFGNTDKKVDGNDAPPDGTQPNFAYAPNGGGWEASFSVSQISINDLNVHAQVSSGGEPQTSAVAGRAIAMSITCSTTEPEPEGDADATITKSASVASIDAGGTFTYTLVVTNTGDAEAKNVVVTDNSLDPPLILSNVSASQGSCTITNNNLSCNLGDVAAQGSVTITFDAETTTDACPRARNQASVSADNDVDTTNNASELVTVNINCDQEPSNPPDDEDEASLNIRKVDEEGNRLPGAVFEIEGMQGTFTTGPNGHFCITGLPNDSVWTVTEIQAPEGYEIAEDPSQEVEVDDDGDCNSPDAVFVNTLADEEQPNTPPSTPPSPRENTQAGNPTPSPTPRGDTKASNATPKPAGAMVPDTAMTPMGSPPVSPALMALVAMASLLTLIGVRVAEARRSRC